MVRHVIIGAGPAGVTAAETLRAQDPDAVVTVIGDEPEPPYSRMAIPYLLHGRIAEQGTYLRQRPDHYERIGVEVLRARVVGADTTHRRVALADGSAIGYDRLLVASGSTPLAPPFPGVELPGVHPCWTLSDARKIAERAKYGARVVLIGAGFIGCILLEALMRRGVHLSVVETAARMVPRMMNAKSGELIKHWCERAGVEVRVSTAVEEIRRDARGRLVVVTAEGPCPGADLVITAVGVRPNIDFLQGGDVKLRRGVLVDNHLQSSVAGVYAAGDVAEGRDFSTGEYAVNAIQPTATEHGRLAALNMAGLEVRYPGSLAMNVLDTLGLVSCAFGNWRGAETGDSVELAAPGEFRYLQLQLDGDVLVGANTVGYTQHLGVLRGLIQGRIPLGPWRDRLLKNPLRFAEAYLARATFFS